MRNAKLVEDVACLPTYEELADLVCELAETNVANIDGEYAFVRCFTFGAGNAPDHWIRALAAREALIASRVTTRRHREYDKSKVRKLRNHEIPVGKGRAK